MERNHMLDAIKNIIAEYVDIPKECIAESTVFYEDLQMDSFVILNMVCKIESEFDIELFSSDMKNIYTVGDLVLLIKTKKGACR